jgi:predicted NBD/HSP70 family sugar kinase
MLLNLSGGDKNAITAEVVEKAWKAGDPMATQVLEETMDLLTVWLGSTIDVLEPDAIVVGGGVGELASHFFDRIESNLPQWSINQRCREIPLKLAHYRADSGIAGGAALCCGALEGASAAGVRA